MATLSGTLSSRSSFTAQFIVGAGLYADRAAALEASATEVVRERAEHRSAVVSAVLQAVAGIEAELGEVLLHGPAHYRGSSELNHRGAAALAPHVKAIERQAGVLARWKEVLRVLGVTLDVGRHPGQSTALLIGLRNELTHHKSTWGGELGRRNLLAALMRKRFALPPWVPSEGLVNDFPARVLVASCARWATETAAAFLDHVGDQLRVPSVLDHYRNGDFADLLPPRVAPP
jgi:hypothetical protein